MLFRSSASRRRGEPEPLEDGPDARAEGADDEPLAEDDDGTPAHPRSKKRKRKRRR